MPFQPVVSVIIPCYNHSVYLGRAIKSVLSQTYTNHEIVVIDDGSTDNSSQVAKSFKGVNYFFQSNQGLSAARNKGISKSTGEFLVFLDADDWLCPDALQTNVLELLKHKDVAFVSGAYLKTDESGSNEIVKDFASDNHYQHFLERNYIGMIATVMFRRWVFDHFLYDTTLKACEDYDIFLKIARNYPVLHHQSTIAAYFFHDANMSNNIPLMLENALLVLKRQKRCLQNPVEKQSFRKGIKSWKQYYSLELYDKMLSLPLKETVKKRAEIKMLAAHNKLILLKIGVKKMLTTLKKIVKRLLFNRSRDVSEPGSINFGDLNRTSPISTEFGYDRGGPVDRYYIENFLEENKLLIHGQALEIGDNEYTLRFGAERVIKANILHIDDSNPHADYIGDLSNIPLLPDEYFDCIVLTQTLHLIYQTRKALETCYRVLKPGGSLLITVPGISHIDHGEWKDIWLWAFTETSIQKMLAEVFPIENIKTRTHGNVLVATAFLYGLGLPELKKEQLDSMDPHYQVIITALAFK